MPLNLLLKIQSDFWILIVIGIAILSCGRETDSTSAIESEYPEEDTLQDSEIYWIDSTTSILTWEGRTAEGRHNGIFKIKEGYFKVLEEEDEDMEITEKKISEGKFVIDMTSLDILDLKHTPRQYRQSLHHMKSSDVFNTEEYPEASFEFISIEKIEKDTARTNRIDITEIQATHNLKGILKIKDMSEEIEFPVRIDIRNLKLEASSEFNLRRSGWRRSIARSRSSAGDDMIKNITKLGFEIIAYTNYHQ